jgi:hypothetical protein
VITIARLHTDHDVYSVRIGARGRAVLARRMEVPDPCHKLCGCSGQGGRGHLGTQEVDYVIGFAYTIEGFGPLLFFKALLGLSAA